MFAGAVVHGLCGHVKIIKPDTSMSAEFVSRPALYKCGKSTEQFRFGRLYLNN